MNITKTSQRVSRLILCISPVLILGAAASRALRESPIYQTLGVALFVLVAVSAWWLSRSDGERRSETVATRAAGMLLLSPLAWIGLLWVGLGTPWEATPVENEMRYAVLLAASIGVTIGLHLAFGVLGRAGARLWGDLGAVANLLSGGGFVVWTSFQLGFWAMRVATGSVSEAMANMNNVFDALLFAAGALAYVTVTLFAGGLGAVGWLGRRATWAYVALNVVALGLLLLRGVAFPSPTATSEPWYTSAGFVVGIPAMPWLMPFLLGVVLLRRAGCDGP
jgi:hypothetical protein